MSQKSEKLRRQVEALKGRMDAMENSAAAWYAAEQSVHSKAVLDATAERNAERRRARQAERTAATWRRIAYVALMAAIIVEVIAIMVIHASADDDKEPIEPPMGVTAAETSVEADVGPEEAENERIEAALLARANVLEEATVTHYDCCVACCGKDDGITASGVRATPGVTVAVDPAIIPLGSDVLVDYGDGEIHYYRADDVGGNITGSHIDLCVENHDIAENLGIRTATVYWVEPEVAKTIWQ